MDVVTTRVQVVLYKLFSNNLHVYLECTGVLSTTRSHLLTFQFYT